MISSSKKKKYPFPLLYAGSISFYALWAEELGKFDIHENYTKQTIRSRTRLYGANSVIALSIPIQSGAHNSPISKVKISNIDPWQRTHWRTLVSSYKSSPFFEFYAYLFEPHFTNQFDSLLDFNLAIHQTILQCLQLEIEPHFTNTFHPVLENDLRIIYSSKKPHLKANLFPEYQQVFSYQKNFEPDLSVLDALFNLGPETLTYLRSIYALVK